MKNDLQWESKSDWCIPITIKSDGCINKWFKETIIPASIYIQDIDTELKIYQIQTNYWYFDPISNQQIESRYVEDPSYNVFPHYVIRFNNQTYLLHNKTRPISLTKNGQVLFFWYGNYFNEDVFKTLQIKENLKLLIN